MLSKAIADALEKVDPDHKEIYQENASAYSEKLKDLDSVAYVRFASVYREFKDVNTFMDEIKKILKK